MRQGLGRILESVGVSAVCQSVGIEVSPGDEDQSKRASSLSMSCLNSSELPDDRIGSPVYL